MANREHLGHAFYIQNPLAGVAHPAPTLGSPRGRRRDGPRAERWQWWRWSCYHDPNARTRTMDRLTVFRTPWLWLMLHWHHGADQPQLHTHWSWLLSFIVRGSYDDERVDGVKRRWLFNFVRRGVYHRIDETYGKVFTICVTGRPRDTVLYRPSPRLETP